MLLIGVSRLLDPNAIPGTSDNRVEGMPSPIRRTASQG